MRKKIRTRKFIYAIMPIIGMLFIAIGYYVPFVGFFMGFGFPLIFAGMHLYYRELEKEGWVVA
ncbi:MAG: hypothetical protein GWN14_03835 [candidate division Zixibacteria bacterium]|jgi:hypothetical protein|nr:hypothetical protein [Deltaproteobacteria bacterium]NIX55070.1 hypothetical protein [candidate division Zixibacteria bacterium]